MILSFETLATLFSEETEKRLLKMPISMPTILRKNPIISMLTGAVLCFLGQKIIVLL